MKIVLQKKKNVILHYKGIKRFIPLCLLFIAVFIDTHPP